MPAVLRFVIYGIAKTLTKVFSIATIAFFGRMPSRDDDRIALVGLLALTWVPILVAVPFPAIGKFLIPFAPEDEQLTRIVAAGIVVVIPFLNGWIVGGVHNQDGEARRVRVGEVFRGWWYTLVIGFTMATVVIVVPIVKAGHVARRYEVERLMVMVPADGQDALVEHICEVLHERGIEASPEPPPAIVRRLFDAMSYILGQIFRRDVARDLITISGTDGDEGYYEVAVHASDLTIMGEQKQTSRVYAVLAEGLDPRAAYVTWDDESQAVEDRLRDQWQRLEDGDEVDEEEVAELVEELATVELDQEEWNNLRRYLYRLERGVANAARSRNQVEPQA